MKWQLTHKRRENLTKLLVSAFTIDLAAVIIPFTLRSETFNASILAVGWIILIVLILIIYFLEE